MNKTLLIAILSLGLVTQAFAQDDLTVKKEEKSVLSEDGWKFKAIASGSISFGNSENVIGQVDGESATLGADFDGEANFRASAHEVRNSLKIKEATSKSPALPVYIKSADELNYGLTYLYNFESVPWVSPYVKASASAPIFVGEAKTAEAKTYSRDGGASTFSSDTVRLTEGFRPLETRESAGAFFKIYKTERVKLEARLGYGARQVKAKGSFRSKENKAANRIDLIALEDFEVSGVEGGFDLSGKWDDKSSYGLSGEFLMPLTKPANSKVDKAHDLTSSKFVAKISSKVYDWAVVEYQFQTLKDPGLLDDWQTQQNLVMKFTYSLL